MAFAFAALALFFAGTWWFIYRLLVQMGQLQIRLETMEREAHRGHFLPDPVQDGLPRGSTPPDFELPLVAGGSMRLSDCLGREVLLIFFNPGCAHSLRFIQSLYAVDAERMDREPIPLIVSTGDLKKNQRLFEGYSIAARVLLQEAFEVSTLFRVRGTPMGYFVDRDGRTAGNVLIGAGTLAFALNPSNKGSR